MTRPRVCPAEACQDCVVIRPGTYEEVSAILKLCNETKTPVIPRGGGTGACGAAIPTVPSIIMSMELLPGDPGGG